MIKRASLLLCLLLSAFAAINALPPKVEVGADRLFFSPYFEQLKGKNIGLITNHTAVGREMASTEAMLLANEKKGGYRVVALFAPEHGSNGAAYAYEEVNHSRSKGGIPIYSLHGKSRRPTEKMLEGVDLLVYDIQDIGSRSYTYSTTLFYAMEEAAKRKIDVLVLDRPNPINGLTVDGPMLDPSLRSMVGYINVPYCHGMTIGELARFFKSEYKIGCKLSVVPMKGWRREMSFQDTGLAWIPTSPQVPEATTAFYYPMTGILGELSLVNIGIGYTLPFKVVGAPWIDAKVFAEKLNAQKFPGVRFEPFHYKPFYGKFAREHCQGVLITVTDATLYKPVATQYLILGILKSLYPVKFVEAVECAGAKKEMFDKVNGTHEVYEIMMKSPFIVWPLRNLHEKERQQFLQKRRPYLIGDYSW